MASLREAATNMLNDRNWLCIPLRKDTNGFPKVPIVPSWTTLTRDATTISSLPWEQAEGLGIVLGSASDGLAVLDVDDEELARAIMLTAWDRLDTSPRLVSTARNRLHIYIQEVGYPSPSSKLTVQWDGRPVTVELKANLTQVAAPPTRGYSLINPPQEPAPFPSIADAWEFVVDCLKASQFGDKLAVPSNALVNKGYPEPWQDNVTAGERDEAAYIEAHKLRESGMSLRQALKLMFARFHEDYEQQGISWFEIKKTIESAYRKGEVVTANDNPTNELHLFAI